MKTLLKVMAVANLFASSGGLFTYLRYDLTNFAELSNGGFEVMAYKDIDPEYKVSVPPGGEDSGGTFLFDSISYSCMKPIFVELESSLTLRLSFWCDVSVSELKIITGCNYYSQEILCDNVAHPERNGKWNETAWVSNCSPTSSVSRPAVRLGKCVYVSVCTCAYCMNSFHQCMSHGHITELSFSLLQLTLPL